MLARIVAHLSGSIGHWWCLRAVEISTFGRCPVGDGFRAVNVSEIVMVAAHLYDLTAPKRAGSATAFNPRPTEFGPEGNSDLEPNDAVDMSAKDLYPISPTFWGL